MIELEFFFFIICNNCTANRAHRRDLLPTDETHNYKRVHNVIPLDIFVSSPLSTCTSLLLSITTSSNKLRFGRVRCLRNGEEILYHVKSEFIRLELVCLGVSWTNLMGSNHSSNFTEWLKIFEVYTASACVNSTGCHRDCSTLVQWRQDLYRWNSSRDIHLTQFASWYRVRNLVTQSADTPIIKNTIKI